MNLLKNISLIIVILVFAAACKKETDNLKELELVTPPSNVSAIFDITQDNSGLVTIVPSAEGVTSYMITFGDVSDEKPTAYGLGETISHIYSEGVFTVGIAAVGLTGLSARIDQEINVTFREPENLVVTIEQNAANPNIVSVSATADYASIMDIYFGDVQNEEPVHAIPDSVVTHTYTEPGDYTIKVVAKGGGAASIEYSETIAITAASDPVNLPIDFESFTVNYAFENFGEAFSTVIDNPDMSGINESSRVAQTLKTSGAETWAGSFLTLENPIDFSSKTTFKVKVWSPKSGAVVKLKVENLDNGDISYEVDATTSVSNQWEELSYDFSGIDQNNDYQKVVIFFDFGNVGDDAIYFFDDIKLVPGSFPTFFSLEDFEGEAPQFTAFGDIADIEVVENPDPSGVNLTSKTAKMIKTSGSQTWAGAFFELTEPLDLENYSKISVKTWAPSSGMIIKVKIENDDASIVHEVDIVNTAANAWEELVYDFSEAPAAVYVKLVIFFDFGNPGDDSVYYFDEYGLTN